MKKLRNETTWGAISLRSLSRQKGEKMTQFAFIRLHSPSYWFFWAARRCKKAEKKPAMAGQTHCYHMKTLSVGKRLSIHNSTTDSMHGGIAGMKVEAKTVHHRLPAVKVIIMFYHSMQCRYELPCHITRHGHAPVSF